MNSRPKDLSSSSNDAYLLWKSNKPPPNLTRYNLTSFAITLNELTPGLEVKKMNIVSVLISVSNFLYIPFLLFYILLSDLGCLMMD